MLRIPFISAQYRQSLGKTLILISGFTLLCSLATASEGTESTVDQARQALEMALETRIQREHPGIDATQFEYNVQVQAAAAALEPCSVQPDIDWRGQQLGSRLTPRISCESQGWQFFVPISLSIRQPVVVAATSLSRGQRLSASDVTLRMEDIGSLRMGYYQSPEDVDGFQVARNLRQGDVINAYVVDPPTLIKRGDRVVILAHSGGLTVRTLGEAMRDGQAGRQIPVRNLTSRKIVHAYIRERGIVEISVQ